MRIKKEKHSKRKKGLDFDSKPLFLCCPYSYPFAIQNAVRETGNALYVKMVTTYHKQSPSAHIERHRRSPWFERFYTPKY